MRFLAYKLPDWTLLDPRLELSSPSIIRALSTPKALDASLDRKVAHLLDADGDPLIREWGTAIVAESAHRIDVFIVDGTPTEGEQEKLGITAGGVASYAKDQPWLPADDTVRAALAEVPGWRPKTGEIVGIQIDPLDMVRAIWTMLTAAPRSDLHLTVDDTRSPVRIGHEEEEVEFETSEGEQVEFDAGPYRLAWHNTDDVGGEIDSLAEETPFEWVEESSWDGEVPATRIRLGYPDLGRPRRDNLFFSTATNIVGVSPAEWTEHADEVLVLGNGEGSKRVRAHVPGSSDRLRRVHVEKDKGITSTRRARELGQKRLDELTSAPEISQITVTDHKGARFGTFDVGDVITVRGQVGWTDIAHDYRIVQITEDVEAGTQALDLEMEG